MNNMTSNLIPIGQVEPIVISPEDTIDSIIYRDGKIRVITYSSGVEKEFLYDDQDQLSSIQLDRITIKTFNYNDDGTLSSTTLGE